MTIERADTTPNDPSTGHTLTHEPALDGLRGLAVAAVLLFHGEFAWAKGGFLGVSLFFTLSGYLITRLLLTEHDRTGRVRLGNFWARRARRLWPASLLTLGLVMVLARFAFTKPEVVGLRGDLLASIAQVVNWRFILEGRSYGDLFASPSLVQHFWSLAIEEQMYLLLPLVVVAALRWRHRLVLPLVVAGLMVASAATTIVLHGPGAADRIYYGTDTRAFELLAGVMLAVVARSVHRVAEPRGPTVQLLGWSALGLTLLAWAKVAQNEPILSEGGLWIYAAISAALIVGARSGGPLARMLSIRPIEALGRVSYGVYLLHWPIFRWLSADRLGVDHIVAFALGTAVTLSAATLSFALLEQPVRTRRARWVGAAPRPTMLAGAAFSVAILAVPVLVPIGRPQIDFDQAQRQLREAIDRSAPPGQSAPPGVPLVAFYGDSTGLTVALGTIDWQKAEGLGKLRIVPGFTELGCGLITRGDWQSADGVVPVPVRCRARDEEMLKTSKGLDLAVYFSGAWDVQAYRLKGDDKFRTIEDPILYKQMMREAEEIHDALTHNAKRMAWVVVPDLEGGRTNGVSPRRPQPESDPHRIALYNQIGRQLAKEHHDVVLIDLRGWLEKQPGGMLDPTRRPDGVHFTSQTAQVLARDFLGEAILKALK